MRFFFFFQAEDGIRDGHVTGVQTCALPILRTMAVGWGCAQLSPEASLTVFRRGGGHTRSEERRVGKSVDLGGRRIIKKKNKKKTHHKKEQQKNPHQPVSLKT